MTQQSTDTSKAAKWMLILAWACLFGLLTLVFGDLLEQQANPNQQPVSIMRGEQIEIRLEQNRQGHYVVSGSINGKPAVFLVDTGATSVSIPAHLADEFNLPRGRSGMFLSSMREGERWGLYIITMNNKAQHHLQ